MSLSYLLRVAPVWKPRCDLTAFCLVGLHLAHWVLFTFIILFLTLMYVYTFPSGRKRSRCMLSFPSFLSCVSRSLLYFPAKWGTLCALWLGENCSWFLCLPGLNFSSLFLQGASFDRAIWIPGSLHYFFFPEVDIQTSGLWWHKP